MKRNQKNMIGTAAGVAAGVAAGIAANSVIPANMSMIGNVLKVALGVYTATKNRAKTTYLAGGLGLAAEGASELIAQYTSSNPAAYTPPRIFGFPGVFSPDGGQYGQFYLNGIGAVGDAGVTEQMRY
jgi:hypothetical protein